LSDRAFAIVKAAHKMLMTLPTSKSQFHQHFKSSFFYESARGHSANTQIILALFAPHLTHLKIFTL